MIFPYIVNLTYIFNNKGEVLLQKKARGFGEGKWNGPGGKVEPGETPEESAMREVAEETGLKVVKLKKIGELEFIFTKNHDSNNFSHVYIAEEWSGRPRDRGEGELRWFKPDSVPLDQMWDDDKYWLPQALRGEYVHMRFYFDGEGKVLEYKDL